MKKGIKNKINSCIVTIGEDSYQRILKHKKYYYPLPKWQKKYELKYLFFYRVAPIQAITHYGLIKKHIEDAESEITLFDKLKIFKDPTKKASAYEFKEIIKLNNPIKHIKGSASIQNKIYGRFSMFIKSKNTNDLIKRK